MDFSFRVEQNFKFNFENIMSKTEIIEKKSIIATPILTPLVSNAIMGSLCNANFISLDDYEIEVGK